MSELHEAEACLVLNEQLLEGAPQILGYGQVAGVALPKHAAGVDGAVTVHDHPGGARAVDLAQIRPDKAAAEGKCVSLSLSV